MRTGENIFKRKDGRWEARYRKGRDLSGKLIYGFCYGKTYTEAKNKVEEAKVLSLLGKKKEDCNCFEFYSNAWIFATKPKLRAATYQKYCGILKNHLNPYFGTVTVKNIDAHTVSEFTRVLLYDKNLSPKTVKDILSLLRSILKNTQKFGLSMPFNFIYPQNAQTETRVLTPSEESELERLLAVKADRFKMGVLLALRTGIRVGELCALRFEHVNKDEHFIEIKSSAQRLKAENPSQNSKTSVLIGPPKSFSSIRKIPLTSETEKFFGDFLSGNPTDFVLSRNENCIEPRTMQNKLKKYTEEIGLEGVHFHTLRHSFATRCIESGMDPKTLSELLGHSSVNITLNRYVHSSIETKRKALEKLDSLI